MWLPATGRVVEAPLCDLARKFRRSSSHYLKSPSLRVLYGVPPLDRTFAIHVMPHNNFGFRSQLCSWRLHIERGDLQHKISCCGLVFGHKAASAATFCVGAVGTFCR
ncbi:UNVERIFIED_ORG: hypothetical protein C0V67_00500 [Anaplasma ovis]